MQRQLHNIQKGKTQISPQNMKKNLLDPTFNKTGEAIIIQLSQAKEAREICLSQGRSSSIHLFSKFYVN